MRSSEGDAPFLPVKHFYLKSVFKKREASLREVDRVGIEGR